MIKVCVFIKKNDYFLDIDDCVNHTCANGGLCVDGVNSYSCNCSAGYTGEHCLAGSSKFWPLSCWYHRSALLEKSLFKQSWSLLFSYLIEILIF